MLLEKQKLEPDGRISSEPDKWANMNMYLRVEFLRKSVCRETEHKIVRL